MGNSLYTLTNEFLEIVSQLEELDLDHDTMKDTLDSLQAPIEEKVENVVKYMKSLEALAEAKKAEAKRLNESATKDLNKAEWFKTYLADNLKKANIKEIQAGIFALKFKKGSEVTEVDERVLPFWVHDKEGNKINLYVPQPEIPLGKAELKKLIKKGIEIPGVSLVRNEDSLTIK